MIVVWYVIKCFFFIIGRLIFYNPNCLQDGLGNITAECVECNCNHIGSISDLCDPRSGLCPCKKGVSGVNCDTCSDGFHFFSNQGCIGRWINRVHLNIISF